MRTRGKTKHQQYVSLVSYEAEKQCIEARNGKTKHHTESAILSLHSPTANISSLIELRSFPILSYFVSTFLQRWEQLRLLCQ